MDKIFKQAKDKNVAKVIIYGHTDNLLYSDADHTKKINKSNVKDLFVKGCVVRSESENLLPVKYFETENYAGMVFKSGDSIIAYYSKEYTPEPSGISIIPINSYTTEDTGYGDGFLDITAIVPPVIDEAIFETYSAAIIAALADDSLDNIKHTITIGNQTLTDQIATYDETNEIVYLGNLSLYDDSAEDTGEDWFLIVSSTIELTTRTPMTINFGMNYEVEEPAPSGAILVNKKQYTTVNIPDTNYNIYSFDSSDIDTNNFTIYQQLINSIGLGNINHIVYVGNETFENKKYTLISGTTAGYMGNGYLYNLSQVDTGEDWCYIVGASGMVLATRNAETITFGLDFIEPPPSGRVLFDDDVLYMTGARDEHAFAVEGGMAIVDETFNFGISGFRDESRTMTEEGEELATKITIADDESTISLIIDGTDYGTHEVKTKLTSEGVEMEIAPLLGATKAYAIGNGAFFPSGSFDDTGEDYLVCIAAMSAE